MRKSNPIYKNNEMDWLGKIPIEWKIKKIKYLYRIICGNGFNESLQGQEYGDYPFCKVSDINHSGVFIESAKNFVSQEEVNNNKYNIVPIGSLIFAKIGEALKKNHRKINNVECIIDNNTQALIPNAKMDSKFSYYLFICIDMSWFDNGGTIPCINNQQLLNFFIPDISINEQQKIVSYLDYKTRLIDGLIEKTKQKIELLKEKRTSFINHCVTKGLNPDVEMKDSGVEWIGKIPSHWHISKIKYSADGDRNSFIDGDWIESPYITDKGIRYITTGNIGEGIYKEQGNGFISEKTFKELNCTEVFCGDLLISRLSPPVGRCCIIPNLGFRIITSVDNVILRPNKSVERKYLVYLFNTQRYYEYTALISRGTTLTRVSRTILGNINFPLPPLHEQQQIIEYLDSQTQKIDTLIKKENKRIDLLKEYRQSLISEAVTGKIDVRDEVAV
jgi:type I restriction enzyme S subunit